MNNLFYVILLIHTFWILGFQMLGPMWLPDKYLSMYVFVFALVGMHWILFDNKCIVSILENKLLPSSERNGNDETHYYNVMKKITGVDIPTQKKIQHTIMMANFIIIGYIYRKNWLVVLLTMICLYTHRWSLWSKVSSV
jgi:hypothetical protein